MNVALLFITHKNIATSLLSTGEAILKKPNDNIACIEVPMDTSITDITDNVENKIAQLSTEDGIMFFTDIYGGTPGNVAQQLATKYNTELVSGVNLPMVLRLLNYRNNGKKELLQKALDGAHQGIQQTN